MSETLTAGEREFLDRHLTLNRDRMLHAIEGLSEGQWKFKPNPESWSAAECCEHVVIVEGALLRRVMEAETLAERPDVAGKEHMLLERVPSRVYKATAPEFARPLGRWSTKADIVEAFLKIRGEVMRYASSTEDPLHMRMVPHFALGPLDGFQWLVFISAHCERHVRQFE